MERSLSDEEIAAFMVLAMAGTVEDETLSKEDRRGKILASLAAGVAASAASVALADPDEFHMGLNPSANVEVRDPSGVLLTNGAVSLGGDSYHEDIISLPSQGSSLVSVYDYSGINGGDVFEVTDSGANALNLGMSHPMGISVDQDSGLFAVADRDTSFVKVCEITNPVNCEDYDLSSVGINLNKVQLHATATEPYVVAFYQYDGWAVFSLGQDTDSDPFPDGVATWRAGSPSSYVMPDSEMDRFTTDESITFTIKNGLNELGAIEVDGASLSSLASANYTPIGTIPFSVVGLSQSDGNLYISGTGSIITGKLEQYSMGFTPSTTTWNASFSLGVAEQPAFTGVSFDSNGDVWMAYSDWVGDDHLIELDPVNLTPTGASQTFTGTPADGVLVFSILTDGSSAPVDADGDGSFVPADCDDADPLNFPSNPEVCDNQDNNCDSTIDEGFDGDGDGFTTCDFPTPDCDDGDINVNPGATEILSNGIDDDCDPSTPDTPVDPDVDGDGFPASNDCNDNNPNVNPGEPETLLNGIDDDCNPSTLDDPDGDGDGSPLSVDCDDGNASNFPGNSESCDNADNDCDSTFDEGFDGDGDGYTSCDTPVADCDDGNFNVNPGVAEVLSNGLDDDCNPATSDIPADPDVDGDGFPASTDCNDGNAAIYPGAPETCDDTTDSDCDGTDNGGATIGLVPTFVDGDLDGEAADGASPVEYCPSDVPVATVLSAGADCDDGDALIFSGATETCGDGIDQDCDGADEACAPDDVDGDGYTTDTDCDDNNPAINPGADELCSTVGVDDDCNDVDESVEGYLAADAEDLCDDADGDGAGDPTSLATQCPAPGLVDETAPEDCDDSNPLTYEGAPELMNGEDNDCDEVDAPEVGQDIAGRDEAVLGSTTDVSEAGPNFLEAGGSNIMPVQVERTTDLFDEPLDLFAYRLVDDSQPGNFTVNRIGEPEINVYEVPVDAPGDYVPATSASVTGSRLNVQHNVDGTVRYEVLNITGNHRVEIDTTFYSDEMWEEFLVANPEAEDIFILGTGEYLIASEDGEILSTNSDQAQVIMDFIEEFENGDDDDSGVDDDDSADDDDDATPDDDDATADDDDVTANDDDSEGNDDDDSTPGDIDGCEGSGCNFEGQSSDEGLDQMPPMDGTLLGIAVILTAFRIRARRLADPWIGKR